MAMKRLFAPVPRNSVQRFAPGEPLAGYESGDFVLTHGDAWTSRLIRFGQRLRIRGDDRKFTYWNHAALVVSEGGELVEALGSGVQRTHVDRYDSAECHLVRIGASAEDRKQAVAFAEWAVGEDYGFGTLVSIAWGLITGGKFTFGFDGQAICSGLVAMAMERTGAIFNRTPTHVMPADLAKYYGVEPPSAPEVTM
ncbi:MAG TPA: hypothetical protein VFJ85_12160 [Acidimicrobiales bacterium]|nr:hypothetical protein [Acidimicrobiales bacterium]